MKDQFLPPPQILSMDNTILRYIETLVTEIPKYTITKEDIKKIHFQGISQIIYEKLTSSQFRTAKITAKISNRIKEACLHSINENKPIHITIPFGGYKRPHLPSYPFIDWAEVFTCVTLRKYIAPIATLYKPGVLIEFYSDEIVINAMNNIPQESLDAYNNDFANFIHYFRQFTPPNTLYKFSKIRDHITQEELFRRFSLAKDRLINFWVSLPRDTQELYINHAASNYFGDLTALSNEKRRAILTDSYLIHEALIKSHWDNDISWAFGKGKIPIGFRYAESWGIQIKSSLSSVVQFWVGTGILRQINKKFLYEIIGYEAYKKTKNDIKKVPIFLFPKKFRYLSSIPVVNTI